MQELAGELPLESTAPVADPLVPSTENSSATEAGKVIDVASAPTAATIQPPVAPTIAQPVKTPRSSATAKKALAPTQHPRVKFDYEQVNWKLTNCEIAEIWNLKRHRVKQIRSDRNRGPAGKFPQEECERLKELERAKVAMWVSNHYDSINSTSAPESDQPKQPSTEVAS